MMRMSDAEFGTCWIGMVECVIGLCSKDDRDLV